jgi:hypothetical protein
MVETALKREGIEAEKMMVSGGLKNILGRLQN